MPITIHTNEEIKNVAIQMEEHIFVNCKIISCVLAYDGGPYRWENTSFVDCQWAFRREAQYTYQLLQTIGLLKPQQTPPANLSTSTTVH